ncbi:MAG: hypothetical protein PGN34_00230 [Methylobacterium frigidaeris]
MPHPVRSAVAALLPLILSFLPDAAAAQGFAAERVFPLAGACYGRSYDAAHLARHPGQVVTRIALWGSSRSLIETRRYADRIDPELALTIRVTFTDGRIAEGEIGCFEEAGRIRRCGRNASCSGDVAVEALPDGRLRIVNDGAATRADNAPGRQGFSPDASCPSVSRAGRFVPPDAENRTFLLAPLPLADCAEPAPRR